MTNFKANSAGRPAIVVDGVSKTFTLHLKGGTRFSIVESASFEVHPGECVVLDGPSGSGKSSLLKMIYGNYRCDSGRILVADELGYIDVATASPRQVMSLRRSSLSYVSQFLRVIPRVTTLDVVAEPLINDGVNLENATAHASELLARLRVPKHLWQLSPTTFSGGEQQRINIARGFASTRPVLLLDEPTASLDGENRNEVLALVEEQKRRGVAILAVFHDTNVRDRLADRRVDVREFLPSSSKNLTAA